METTFKWHPATEKPRKNKSFLLAYKVKGHLQEHYCFADYTFLQGGSRPVDVDFKNGERLPVAWAYLDEISCGITDDMLRSALFEAAWWEDKQ